MKVLFRWVTVAVLGLALVAGSTAEAQQTGVLSGVVRDAQGGVLPGVTVNVTGEALGGAARSTVSTDQGLTPSPACRRATTRWRSSSPASRPRPATACSCRSTAPPVSTSSSRSAGCRRRSRSAARRRWSTCRRTVTQTNITKDLYESIPTGRNPWVMAGLVPGVITGRLDVGGTEGMQQYNLEAFGSANSQKSFSIDGLKTNWAGGDGGSTMQYYGFEMYEEYNMQTASGTAESDVSGVYMNMVTKSGGNRFNSDNNFYFMNDALQGDNIDDDLRGAPRPWLGGADRRRRQPDRHLVRLELDLGGPVVKDRLFFFGALRRWRLDQFQIGALNADGSQAIDDNRIENYMGKATWQAAANTRASFMFNRNLKNRFHRRDAPYLFVEDIATTLQDQPAQNYVAQVNQVVGQRGVLDLRFGRMWGVFPSRYQDGATDIAVRDTTRFTRINAAEIQSLNPNHRYQANGNFNYFVPSWIGGSHDFKAGVQLSWERMAYDRLRNGDILLELRDGTPFQANIANTPIVSDHKMETWGGFLQDRWVIGRATVNVGVRLDGVKGFLPEQSSPAGTYVGERAFPETDIFDYSMSIMPRIGVSYDVFGNGQTAIKAYYGRFFNQFGSEIVEAANPNALATQSVVWNDLDGDVRLDAGELGAVPAFQRGLFPAYDQDADRPYSDEMNVGVEHQLVQNLAVGVSYHRRQHRDGLGLIDRARPASAYTPEARTYTDVDGQVEGHHHLQAPPGLRRGPRPRHHQRRRARERLRRRAVRLPEEDVEPLADARRTVAAEAQRLRPQRHLHHPDREPRFQQPQHPDQPRRRLGVHRPAVDLHDVGQLPAPVEHERLGQVHRARRRPAEPQRHAQLHQPDPDPAERGNPRRAARRGSDRDGEQVPRPAAQQAPADRDRQPRVVARHVQRDERQPRAAAERGHRHDLGPADPHPDAADHPLRPDRPFLGAGCWGRARAH